jgi:exopolyphosphatase/guanosine-5'-triphosphate,3'-diphosphate pyrophosphatase
MKRYSLIFILAIFLLGFVIAFSLPSIRNSLAKGEVRAALDIGSGATNLKIAKIDPKTNKLVATLFEKSIPVPYQKHLEQSPTNTFDEEVITQGIKAIQTLKEISEQHHAKKIVAVATAAFRQAANAQQVTQTIEQKTGVKVHIINQDEEGILAFRGALAIAPVTPQDAVVWDIGGGSMQLTTLSPQGTYLIEKGKLASIPFKNFVLENIKGTDPKISSSPNPLIEQDMKTSLIYARQKAEETSSFMKEKLAHPDTRVFAVGSLFNYGILPVVKDHLFTIQTLDEAVMKWANKTDSELPGGSLVEVTVTNPLLVLGYMQELHIKQVDILNVNNTDGVLTYPPYWE